MKIPVSYRRHRREDSGGLIEIILVIALIGIIVLALLKFLP